MSNKVTIIQGEDSVFTLKLRDEEGDPFDLTSYDQYKVCLQGTNSVVEISQTANANGSIITLLGSAILGKLQVQINNVDTALLLADERVDIDLVLNNSGSPAPKKAKFKNVLTVLESLC